MALAAAPGGHLWVLWFDYHSNVIHAAQTNASATGFGKVLTYFLALLELWRGRRDQAGHWATALAEMVGQAGDDYYWFCALLARGQIDAHAGRLDAATAAADEAVAIAIATGDTAREAEARQLLGFVALSKRDLREAANQLTAWSTSSASVNPPVTGSTRTSSRRSSGWAT